MGITRDSLESCSKQLNILELKRREGTGRVPRVQMFPTGGDQRKALPAVNGASRCNADGLPDATRNREKWG